MPRREGPSGGVGVYRADDKKDDPKEKGTPVSDVEQSQPTAPDRPPKVKNRRRHVVRDAYAARSQQLVATRGPVVMPTHDRWYQNFKPRMLAYWLVRFAITVAMCTPSLRKVQHIPTFIPRPSWHERRVIAITSTKAAEYHEMKVVSVFSLKGGIGKTTLTRMMALFERIVCDWLVVLAQDCNKDQGNLSDRGPRTSRLSIVDAIENIGYIKRLADLMRYCTHTDEGLLVLASSRSDEELGTAPITAEGLRELHDVEKDKVSRVYNDLGTSTESDTFAPALDVTHQVVLPTSPSADSVLQLKRTLNDLLHNHDGKYADLARNSIVVITRWRLLWRPFTSPDKIRSELVEKFGDDVKDVRVFTVNSGLFMLLGLPVVPRLVSRRQKVQIMELNAAIASRLADATVGEDLSQLTHKEQLEQERSAQVESDPVALHPENDLVTESA